MCFPRSSSTWREKVKQVTQWPRDAPDQNTGLWLLFGIWTQLHATEKREGHCRCQAVPWCILDPLGLSEGHARYTEKMPRPHLGFPCTQRLCTLRRLNLAVALAKRLQGLAPPQKDRCCPNCAYRRVASVSLWNGTSCLETGRAPAGEPRGSPKVRKNTQIEYFLDILKKDLP